MLNILSKIQKSILIIYINYLVETYKLLFDIYIKKKRGQFIKDLFYKIVKKIYLR